MLLQFSRAKEPGDPYGFRFEPQDYTLPSEGGASPSARFEWTQAVLDDLRALRLPGRDPAVVQRMGERLRRFVQQAGFAEWERQIAEAIAVGRPVVVTIRSSAAELYALPWELLTLKSGQFLGEVELLLVRCEWPESESTREQPSPRDEGGRILLAWSAAAGAVPAAEHIAAIGDACAAGFHPFDPSRDVLAQASVERLVGALHAALRARSPIAVLHLLCHGAEAGSTFGLALDGEGGAVEVDAQQLRAQLAPFAKSVRLVVLSACDSGNAGALGNQLGSVALELHRCGFAAVIASRFPLSVAGAITLAHSFYRALLTEPASVEMAFLKARRSLALAEAGRPRDQRTLDWASLQLYARQADGDDTRPLLFRPFRGLLAFQPEHQRFFFGREAEVAEVLDDLRNLVERQRPRFLVVAGASGTGKSSLVFAGAVPALLAKEPQLMFLRMRPGRDPDAALNEALAKQPAGAAALLVVDQFEEVFTQTTSPAAREALVRRLWSLASAPEPGLRVIVTLRVDFIGRCGELVANDSGLRLDRIAYDEEHRIFVAQIEPAQLRKSIEGPAYKVGLELQAGLVDRMVKDVGEEPGALPLLEDALDVLWQHRSGRVLTQQAYDALGGVVGALQMRADAIIDKLGPQDQALAQRLLLNLVAVADETALDTRLRVSLSKLRQDVAAADLPGFERVLNDLVAARLLVQGDDKQTPSVEAAHEALIRKWPRLRGWIDENRAGLVVQRRVRQAAEQWVQQGHDESLLYRGAQLVQASEWRRVFSTRLGEQERSFLDASEALRAAQARQAEARLQQERTRARQTRIAAVVLGVFFLVALGAGWLAYWNALGARESAAQAQKKAQESRQRLLVAAAQAVKRDPTAVATLLREAGPQSFTLWQQSAVDALQTGIADGVLRGHGDEVKAVAFSPDGKRIATGSKDSTARIWNADGSGSPLVLNGHGLSVTSVAYSPDGKKLVTGSADKTVRIWNTDGHGAPLLLARLEQVVAAVAFSPDGQKLGTVGWDAMVRIWNAEGSGKPVASWGPGDALLAIAFSPDGTKMVIGGMKRVARIQNVDGSGNPMDLEGHKYQISSVAFSPDGTKIATGSHDNTVRILNSDGQGLPRVLSGHDGPVTSVAFSPDGKTIATGSSDQTARLWSVDDLSPLLVFTGHEAAVTSVAFSPDGKTLVTGSDDHSARIWKVPGSRSPLVLTEPKEEIAAVAFSPDGKKLATGSQFGSVQIWNVDGSGRPVVLTGHTAMVDSVAFSPDGKKLATGSRDRTARIFNADGSGSPIVFRGHEAYVLSVAFSPDGKKLATGSMDGTVRVFNADDSGSPVVLKRQEGGVFSVAFSPDGSRLATAGGIDKTAHIFNADGSGTPIVLKGHKGYVSAVAFSPDGKTVATGGGDCTVGLWKADGSGAPLVLTGHREPINSIAFSPDGARLVSGSSDDTARVFNTDGSGAPIVLTGHRSSVLSVAFSPDGSRIATGSLDMTTRVFIVGSEALWDALWNATSDCLPESRRQELLIETHAAAQQGYRRCRAEVARRHGWPTLAEPLGPQATADL